MSESELDTNKLSMAVLSTICFHPTAQAKYLIQLGYEPVAPHYKVSNFSYLKFSSTFSASYTFIKTMPCSTWSSYWTYLNGRASRMGSVSAEYISTLTVVTPNKARSFLVYSENMAGRKKKLNNFSAVLFIILVRQNMCVFEYCIE